MAFLSGTEVPGQEAEALGLRGIRAERVTCPGLLSLRKFLLLGSRGRLVRLRGCLIAHARYTDAQ